MARQYTRPAPLIDVLEEHIGEAAFMYDLRRASIGDPARSWEDLEKHETRMIPHLDALRLGEFDSALLLKEKLALEEDGDPGEAFVAGAVYPMLDFIEPMQWLTESLCQRPPHFGALVDGLKLTKGRNLDGWIEYFLDHENPGVRAIGADVAGHRESVTLADRLDKLRSDPDPHVSMAAISALAGMGTLPRKDAIVPFLGHADHMLAWKAEELLLVAGGMETLSILREALPTSGPEINRKRVFLVAVAGDPGDMSLIADVMARQPETTRECLLAMALCGNPDAVDLLIPRLAGIDEREQYEAACQGLRMITGMDFHPSFDLDEAGDEEVKGYQGLWVEWWGRNQRAFSKESKWRRGEEISPSVLHRDLLRPGNTCRDMTHLEMLLRYGCPVGFRHDGSFGVQIRKLDEIRSWAIGENGKYRPGKPYFHGKPLS